MGQIIDLDQRRLAAQPHDLPPTGSAWDWSATHAAYLDGVVMPSVDLWRISLALWAKFWLAPMGLEVKAVELRRSRLPDNRADVSR